MREPCRFTATLVAEERPRDWGRCPRCGRDVSVKRNAEGANVMARGVVTDAGVVCVPCWSGVPSTPAPAPAPVQLGLF